MLFIQGEGIIKIAANGTRRNHVRAQIYASQLGQGARQDAELNRSRHLKFALQFFFLDDLRLSGLERAGQGIASLADFGCGLGVGYADAFRDRRYIGLDLSARNVEWCRHNRSNPLHRYACVDFVVDGIGETADVVSSSGTIDNAYDVDAFVQSMIRASSGWIYFTCYRGWFPDLREHRYSWDEKTTCFYNDISPRRIRSVLERAGCTEVDIRPMATGRSDVRYETRVIARVPVKPAHETGSIRAAAE